MPAPDNTTFVRVGSHRATDKLKGLVGDLDWYFNMWEGGCFVAVPNHLLDEARKITGITKARPKHELYRCFNS